MPPRRIDTTGSRQTNARKGQRCVSCAGEASRGGRVGWSNAHGCERGIPRRPIGQQAAAVAPGHLAKTAARGTLPWDRRTSHAVHRYRDRSEPACDGARDCRVGLRLVDGNRAPRSPRSCGAHRNSRAAQSPTVRPPAAPATQSHRPEGVGGGLSYAGSSQLSRLTDRWQSAAGAVPAPDRPDSGRARETDPRPAR